MAGRAGKARRTTCPWPPADRTCAARSSSGAADIDPLDLASDAVRRAQAAGAGTPGGHAVTLTPPAVYIEDDGPQGAPGRGEKGPRGPAAEGKQGAVSPPTPPP